MLTAEDGWEALQVAERLGRSIEAVLTDMVMPKMGGTELGVRLRCLLPHLKIVYMTGYLEQSDNGNSLVEDAFFLQKPFTRKTLVSKLNQALKSEQTEWQPQPIAF